jgi:hypothetical protein
MQTVPPQLTHNQENQPPEHVSLPISGALPDAARTISMLAGGATIGAVIGGPIGAFVGAAIGTGLGLGATGHLSARA